MIWVTGADSIENAMNFVARITLKGVAEKITCPLLIVHGVDDCQVSVEHARQTYDAAINSRDRKLIVLGADDGGVEHCSTDNGPLNRETVCDWIAGVLHAEPQRPTA